MNRTGLVIALAVAAVVGLVFGIWPDLDLKLAALFYRTPPRGFWRSYDPIYLRLRDAVDLADRAGRATRRRRARRSSWCARAGRCSFPAAPSC